MIDISKYGELPKVWTSEELAKWKQIQEEVNAEYKAAAEDQLVSWVNGVSKHNHHLSIYAIVDENDTVVGYSHYPGGECCPDFSCCEPKAAWSMERRKKFYELHKSGNSEATAAMLFGALAGVVEDSAPNTYIAGQINTDHTVH